MKDEFTQLLPEDAIPVESETALKPPASSPSTEQINEGVPITYITGTNGQVVTCTYLNHPGWDPKTNLCLSLHFIMVKCAPRRTSSWGYQLRLAIDYFLNYRAELHASSPVSLHLNHIKDITPSIYKGFEKYLNKIGKSPTNASKLNSAISVAAKETDLIPNLDLPRLNNSHTSSTEPLHEDGVESLTRVTQQIVDAARATIERREVIDATEPYTLEELKDQFTVRLTKEDILVWLKYMHENDLKIKKNQALFRLNKCDAPEIRALRNESKLTPKLRSLLTESENVTVPEGYDPDLRKADSWQSIVLDPYRVVKTLVMHGFPHTFSKHDLTAYGSKSVVNLSYCDDVIKLILHKLTYVRAKYNNDYGKRGSYMMSLDEHLALYYPTALDMAGITMLMMLQAGWNKETVMDIDPNGFEHALTAAIEESIKIVCSEKNRSQGRVVPYKSPKQLLAASDSDNPYSIYNLILLAKEFSAPLAAATASMVDPIRNRSVNTMFSHLRRWMGWASAGDACVATIDYSNQFALTVNDLLEKYEIVDNGKRLSSANELTVRLRATWLFYNAEKTPFAFLSQLMGHESRDTSDKFYDNSPQARNRRIKRLRSALNKIVELLRARKFKGLFGKTSNAVKNKDLSIFYLPHLERPLWACSNRYKPDWPGAPELPKDSQCNSLEQCLFCSRVWILEDSLPYLIERLAHIEELLHDGSFSELGNRLEAEQEEINAILDEWGDEGAIEKALEYRTLNAPLLPRELRDLRLIFREGHLNE